MENMPAFVRHYVHIVDGFNKRIGRFAMYGIFAMFAVLLWSSISKTFLTPSLWTLEVAQFLMVAYYILGGPYSMQLGAHVRMDLFYGDWDIKKKASMDVLTALLLLFYLGILVYGAIDSTSYALQYNERSPTAWRPVLWPIKVIATAGFILMFMQTVSELFKDIAVIRFGDQEEKV